jgi:oligoribonuclease
MCSRRGHWNFLGSVTVPTLAAAAPVSDSPRGAVTGDTAVAGGRGGRLRRCVLSGGVAESAGHLVWIDCEMTGLDLVKDKLIEVAVLVTDSELNVLDPGLDLIIGADDADLDDMNEVVRDMHAKSGLTDQVRVSTLTVAEAEQQLLAYIKRWVPDRRTAPLCGNSIGTDRGFLARDMPELDDHLHYRMVDVSSVKELARRWFPRVYFAQPAKGLAHRALADIIESVRELAYYRRTLFVPAPGPNSDQAKGAAEEVVGTFAALLAAGDANPPQDAAGTA